MRAYFDSNVFVSLEEGALTVSEIVAAVDSRISEFPFSAAHIEEADNILGDCLAERQVRIERRLSTIRSVSQCLYLYHGPSNQTFLRAADPAQVLQTIREVPFAKPGMKTLTNLITAAHREQARASLGLESRVLNNVKPQEIIPYLDIKLKALGANMGVEALVQLGEAHHPDHSSFDLTNRIGGMLEILDMLGYWKDSEGPNANMGRLWDASHTASASFCDYFVSSDLRARRRAQAVFHHYGISTVVLRPDGIHD